MKITKIAAATALVVLTGCQQVEKPTPVAAVTTGNGYDVAKLFEHDGCAVYRFQDDNHPRYFAKCGKTVTEEHAENCGHDCTNHIQTTSVQEEGNQ